ncbi:MAG: prolyl oligopeptidase family serine peptidase [Acidobacteriia bacterium]|nr:prolyl oligopeptidase family serine peptidase [Terriglobia bacterium]
MRRAVFLFLLVACRAFAAGKPFQPEDLWLWRSLSDPRISSDGLWVAYIETGNDRNAGAARSALWLVSGDGQTRRRLADGIAPRFSPDASRIAWISGNAISVLALSTAGGRSVPPVLLAGPFAADPLQLAWSPDGKRIACATRDGAFEIPAIGGAVRPLSPAESRRIFGAPREFEDPLPSPDGRKVAFLARDPKPRKYVVRKLYVMNSDGSRARPLSGALDRDAASPQWSSDSRTVYFLAQDGGETHAYAARSDGTLRKVTAAPERLAGFSLAANGRAVTVTSGMELISFSVFDAADRLTLASPNREWLSRRDLLPVDKVVYESAAWNIDAWITRPVSSGAIRHPALILTDETCGEGFDLPSQILASAGLTVFCANPRGAPGYGEEFGNLLPARDPADAFDDVMRGVDFLVARGIADPERLFITGGALAAWAIGHTDRFAGAVARRPLRSDDPPSVAMLEIQAMLASMRVPFGQGR